LGEGGVWVGWEWEGEAGLGGGEEGKPAVEGYGDAVEEEDVGQVATVQTLRLYHF